MHQADVSFFKVKYDGSIPTDGGVDVALFGRDGHQVTMAHGHLDDSIRKVQLVRRVTGNVLDGDGLTTYQGACEIFPVQLPRNRIIFFL